MLRAMLCCIHFFVLCAIKTRHRFLLTFVPKVFNMLSVMSVHYRRLFAHVLGCRLASPHVWCKAAAPCQWCATTTTLPRRPHSSGACGYRLFVFNISGVQRRTMLHAVLVAVGSWLSLAVLHLVSKVDPFSHPLCTAWTLCIFTCLLSSGFSFICHWFGCLHSSVPKLNFSICVYWSSAACQCVLTFLFAYFGFCIHCCREESHLACMFIAQPHFRLHLLNVPGPMSP